MARGPTVGLVDVSTLDFCTFVHTDVSGILIVDVTILQFQTRGHG